MSDENGNGAVENKVRDDISANDVAEQESGAEVSDIETLQVEIAALKERSLRAMAEAENTRKRAEREKEETRQFAIARFARDLLSVSDNLNRALAACSAEAREEADETLKAVIDGIEATERELQSVLSRHGVKAIEAEGAKFDPNLHQAIAEVPAEGTPKGNIVTVVQAGYMIGERLLRAAMVTVAKGDAPTPKGDSENESESSPETST